MRRPRLIVGVAASAAAATTLLVGGVFRDASSAGPAASSAVQPVAATLQTGFSPGDTTGLVRQLQADLRADPRNAQALDLLGLAYQQRARETADPTYYTKSAGVLREALALSRNDLLATSGLGSLALSRHRFADALRLGRRARAISPSTSRNYGVIGDALVELGRYRDAFRAYDTMASLRPGLGAYARVSHARELLGRIEPAIAAMKLALDTAAGQPEPTAWTHVQLGKLYWATGRLGPAAREYRAALVAFPGYVYAFDAIAQVEWAQGHRANAIALERRAVDTIPLPQFVALLGDMYTSVGRPRLARQQYGLIGVIERLLRANGVRTDLETALFDADHNRPDVALARLAERQRPSIDGDDVLAWTLARSGHCAEAVQWSERALRLGTRDALKLFHRGWIAGCLHDRAGERLYVGRALALNPHFSVRWAPVARKEVVS